MSIYVSLPVPVIGLLYLYYVEFYSGVVLFSFILGLGLGQLPHQRLICRKKFRFGVSKQRALVHSVGAILLSTTLPRAIFACNFF